MGRTRRRSAATCMVIGLFTSVAACSSSSNGAIDLGTNPNTISTTSTTPASSTPQPAPTSSSTRSTETSTAPLTPEDQVKADFLAAVDVRRQCGIDPGHCDFESIAVPGSPTDTFTRDLIARRLKNNLRAVVGHGNIKWRIESADVTGNLASLVVCGYDDIVIYDVVDASNPSDDIVFDESTTSARTTWTMELANGRWLIHDAVPIQQLDGGDLCGF